MGARAHPGLNDDAFSRLSFFNWSPVQGEDAFPDAD
jgi:hypothetical protein